MTEVVVEIRKLRFFARVGLWDRERTAPQPIEIDISARLARPPREDKLHETACYDDIAALAKKISDETHHDLIETLAVKIAEAIADMDPVASVEVRVTKAPQTINAESTSAVARAG